MKALTDGSVSQTTVLVLLPRAVKMRTETVPYPHPSRGVLGGVIKKGENDCTGFAPLCRSVSACHRVNTQSLTCPVIRTERARLPHGLPLDRCLPRSHRLLLGSPERLQNQMRIPNQARNVINK